MKAYACASTLTASSVVCYGASEALAKGLQNGPQQCLKGLSPVVELCVLPCQVLDLHFLKVAVENLRQYAAHWLVNTHAQPNHASTRVLRRCVAHVPFVMLSLKRGLMTSVQYCSAACLDWLA